MTIIFLAASAAFVGFLHSLAPGHWLPVVLMTKVRKWPARTAVAAALVASSGHVVISNLLGLLSIRIGAHLFAGKEDYIERHAALALVAFGLIYAGITYF